MTEYVAMPDRIVRNVVVLVAVVLAVPASGVMEVVLWVVAALMLGVGVIGCCPFRRRRSMISRRG